MFNESYYIFSVGNVKPIWREQYPSCWKVRAWQAVRQRQPTPVARLALLSVLPQRPVRLSS